VHLNSDARWALHWGGASRPPTPHPLANVLGALLEPLGPLAAPVWIALCLSALACVGYLVFRLGELWFGRAAGALAAALLLSRPEVVSFAARGYLDLPYLALVLYALLAFTREPEAAGRRVAAALAVAGLLRPEAWLFAAAHVAWRARHGHAWRAHAALAALPAATWLGMDLALTADPLHSLHVTRENTRALGRATGAGGAATSIPGRTAALLGPGLALTLALGAGFAVRRARAATFVLALAVAAAAAVALAGMPVIMRYVLLPATLLTILGAGGAAPTLRKIARWRPTRTMVMSR
jgi:hypothetical protein